MQLHSHLEKVGHKLRSNFYKFLLNKLDKFSFKSVKIIIHLPKVNKEIIFCVQKASERSERVNFESKKM